jgi:hypothetical protein
VVSPLRKRHDWSAYIDQGLNAAANASIRVLWGAQKNPHQMGSEKGNVKVGRRADLFTAPKARRPSGARAKDGEPKT